MENKIDFKLPINRNEILCFKKLFEKRIVNKTDEATGELIGNKIADKIVKPKPIYDVKPSDVEEVVLLPEKR